MFNGGDNFLIGVSREMRQNLARYAEFDSYLLLARMNEFVRSSQKEPHSAVMGSTPSSDACSCPSKV